MTSIGRNDKILLQLREQLKRLSETRGESAVRPVANAVAPPLERLKRAGPTADIDGDDYRRTFVRALLTEEFGDGIGNEPEFDRISSDVWRILNDDPHSRQLIDAAIVELHQVP